MISSPRILRPFTVTLIHKVDEDTFIPYVLENVGFDENYGITQSNKGISDADSVLLTIDLSDCGDLTFVDQQSYKSKKNTFMIGNEDYFVLDVVKETDYDELKKTTNVYSINKYACYRPPGTKEIQFIEVYAS